MTECVVDLFSQLVDNDYGYFQKFTTLPQIMAGDVKKITLDDTFEQIESFFDKYSVHHAPVIADEGHVVGVVSDRDLLRHRPPHLGSAGEGDDDHLALRTAASQLMTRGLFAVPSTATPVQALSVMLDEHVDAVMVHDDDGQLVGIVTPRDLMKIVLLFHQVCTRGSELIRLRLVDLDMKRGLPLDVIFSRGTRSVRDVMTKDVATVSDSDTVSHAIDLMKKLHIRHLPVVNSAGQYSGMLSDRDILRFLPLPVPRPNPKSTPGFRDVLFAVEDRRVLREKVSSIAKNTAVAVKQESLFEDTIRTFMDQTCSGVAVVDEKKQVCGVVTTTDVLKVVRVTLQMGELIARENSQSKQRDKTNFEGGKEPLPTQDLH